MPPAAIAGGAAVAGAAGSIISGNSAARSNERTNQAILGYNGPPGQSDLRSQLGRYFGQNFGSYFNNDLLNMFQSRTREYLDPDYISRAQNNITSPESVYDMLDEYRKRTQGAYNNELDLGIQTANTNLGGGYGLRQGSDQIRILSDVGAKSANQRERTIADMFPALYGAHVGAATSAAGLPLQFLSSLSQTQGQLQDPFLRYALTFPNSPGSVQPFGGSGLGAGLASAGNSLAAYPLYSYLAKN